jgi:hypothetical protein
MELKEAVGLLSDLADASPCVEIEITIEDKQALILAIETLKRIEVEKIQEVLSHWNVTKVLGFDYKCANAICNYLEGK